MYLNREKHTKKQKLQSMVKMSVLYGDFAGFCQLSDFLFVKLNCGLDKIANKNIQ